MADVAKLAGVSHQTVSRVVNDSAQVRPETRRAGPRPRCASSTTARTRPARALVTGRSRTLGVVSFDTTLYGPASTLFAIEQAAHAADYFITHRQPARRSTGRPCCNAIERLRVQGVDGILVISAQEGAVEALVNLRRASRSSRSRRARRSRSRSSRSTSAAARRARPASCSTSATGPSGTSPARATGSRPSSASRAGARRSRRPARDPPPVLAGDWSPRSGYELGRRLAADPDVTAVFVANDQMALGLLRALHERGRQIPGDVSVVGFDDIPEAQYFTPAADDGAPGLREMGRRALRLLLDVMSDRGQPRGAAHGRAGARRAPRAPGPPPPLT